MRLMKLMPGQGKEVKLVVLIEEVGIMKVDLRIMDPTKRTWFEKKQKIDVGSRCVITKISHCIGMFCMN